MINVEANHFSLERNCNQDKVLHKVLKLKLSNDDIGEVILVTRVEVNRF